MAIKTFPLTLKWAEMLTPNVRHLALETADGQPLEFIPGQFISIHFDWEGKPLRRSYSIASIPGQSTLVEFAVSYVENGAASQYLFALEPGDMIQASGPFGRLVLKEEQPERYILVATGTGVTPYRAMLPEIAKRSQENPQQTYTVLLGVQKRQDALYIEDFIKFAEQHPQFQFYVHYSREPASTNLQPYEKTGYVQTAFKELNINPEADLIYLCGNPNMIDDAVLLTKEAGFPIQKVRREKYVS